MTRSASLTRTEHRVLAGMKLRDAANADSIAEAQRHTDERISPHTLQGLDGIVTSVNIARWGGRRSSEREVYGALQKLVAKGLVKSDRLEGMGGALTLYQLVEAD